MKYFVRLFYGLLLIASCNTGKNKSEDSFKQIEMKYPVTKKDTTVSDNYFGTMVKDPYRWLENDTSAETGEWVTEQNKVTREWFSQVPFRQQIENRYRDLFNYEKFSAPFREGNYTYYYRNSGLQNQSVLYRQKEGEEPEVFLDPNLFSKDGTTSLAGVSFTKDGSLCAYQISEGGSDWRKIIVIDAETRKQISDTLVDVKFSGISWLNKEGFFYSSYDKPTDGSQLSAKTQLHKLFFHRLGTAQKNDALIFGGSATPRRYISSGVSENQKWLIIYGANETYGNEIYVRDLTKAGSEIINIIPGMKNSSYVIDVDDQYLYIQTDMDAPTGRVVRAPLSDPSVANWQTLIEARPEVLNTSSAGGFLFCSYLKDAVSKVYQFDRSGKQIREIILPGLGTADGFSAKQEEKELYYTFSSYINPTGIYKMDIAGGETSVFKEPNVKFNPAEYESKQVTYTSKDGTKIPMILTHKKGIELNGNNPCLLYGYGGFSVSLTPYFSTSAVILLENGGIYAVANLRGGGEYGEDWHQQGIKTKKQNVFDDFIAAAEFLIAHKYTSPDKLAIEGGSNGGLLVGACMTQRPELFKVAFPAVGVLDMLRYHKFTAGAGWAYDYGTSEESKEMFDYLYGYSPLHNLKPAAYPATLISTADHDDRVVPAHSFKFAAALQENHTGKNPVLIRIETKAGHGAGKSTDQIIREQAEKWSFMFYNMGISPDYSR